MSSLMSPDRYKNRHQIVSTTNNHIGVMNDTMFQHCKNEKKNPKEDAT